MSQSQVCIKTASDELRRAAESIDAAQPVVLDRLDVGYAYAQGDVGILSIAALPPQAKEIEKPLGGQIAPGNTKGSRHCVEGKDVTYYRVEDGDPLSDIVIEARAPWTLTHPEHANVTCPPGTYRFLHQQNELRQRAVD